MSTPTGDPLSDVLGHAVLDGGPEQSVLDPDRPEDHLAIVARAAVAEQAGRELLRQSVSAARGSGHSWRPSARFSVSAVRPRNNVSVRANDSTRVPSTDGSAR